MDLLDCTEDHRRGALDGPAHQMPWAVAVAYLGKPPLNRHGLAARAGSHVTASQHAGQRIRRRLELGAKDVGESAFAGFDDGAGVMGDQPAQHGIGVLGVAQVPGAVELMQAGGGEARGVADVVQPGGGFQQVGVRPENGCQAWDLFDGQAVVTGGRVVPDGAARAIWTGVIRLGARLAVQLLTQAITSQAHRITTSPPARPPWPPSARPASPDTCPCLTHPHAISTPACTSDRPRPAAAVLAAPGDRADNDPGPDVISADQIALNVAMFDPGKMNQDRSGANADRILVAQLTGEARHRARWRPLTGDEEAAALAELRALADGRADLLAQVAGIFEGTSEGEPDEPLARSAARLCRMAGADAGAIPAWIEEGRRRSANARRPPFSGGLSP
jgi:hypothetical protein